MMQINHFIEFVRDHYASNEFIPLHAPNLGVTESNFVDEALKSTFVSSVGKFVDLSEDIFSRICSTKAAVAVVNGTAALHIALKLAGASHDTEVITQALTFVATANAIKYSNSTPVFLDVNYETMGLSPKSVSRFLEEFADTLSVRTGGYRGLEKLIDSGEIDFVGSDCHCIEHLELLDKNLNHPYFRKIGQLLLKNTIL